MDLQYVTGIGTYSVVVRLSSCRAHLVLSCRNDGHGRRRRLAVVVADPGLISFLRVYLKNGSFSTSVWGRRGEN